MDILTSASRVMGACVGVLTLLFLLTAAHFAGTPKGLFTDVIQRIELSAHPQLR
jgi:hypothetical protein